MWTVPSAPFKGSHFATFPPALVEPCILAGTSAKGVCSACGAPYYRVIQPELVATPKAARTFVVDVRDEGADGSDQGSNRQKDGHKPGYARNDKTLRWAPTCACEGASIVPATVLDPFLGSGTTAVVADRLQRSAIGIELNPEYAAMARRRIEGELGGLLRPQVEMIGETE